MMNDDASDHRRVRRCRRAQGHQKPLLAPLALRLASRFVTEGTLLALRLATAPPQYLRTVITLVAATRTRSVHAAASWLFHVSPPAIFTRFEWAARSPPDRDIKYVVWVTPGRSLIRTAAWSLPDHDLASARVLKQGEPTLRTAAWGLFDHSPTNVMLDDPARPSMGGAGSSNVLSRRACSNVNVTGSPSNGGGSGR